MPQRAKIPCLSLYNSTSQRTPRLPVTRKPGHARLPAASVSVLSERSRARPNRPAEVPECRVVPAVRVPDLDAIQEPLGPRPCPRQLLFCHRRELLSLTLAFRVVRGDLVRRAGERQELSGTVDAQVVPEGPGEHHDEWAHALILPTPRWGIVPRSRLTSSISRYKLYIK